MIAILACNFVVMALAAIVVTRIARRASESSTTVIVVHGAEDFDDAEIVELALGAVDRQPQERN